MTPTRPADYPAHLPWNPRAEAAHGICRQFGLSLTYYNSGAARNRLNGWRVFRGLGRTDYFAEDFLLQRRTPDDVLLWLGGYTWGWRSGHDTPRRIESDALAALKEARKAIRWLASTAPDKGEGDLPRTDVEQLIDATIKRVEAANKESGPCAPPTP